MAQLNRSQYDAAMSELDWIMDFLYDNSDPEHPLRARLLELVDLIQEYEREHPLLDDIAVLSPPPWDGTPADWEEWDREHDVNNPFDPDDPYRA